jgi:hypothetical protein
MLTAAFRCSWLCYQGRGQPLEDSDTVWAGGELVQYDLGMEQRRPGRLRVVERKRHLPWLAHLCAGQWAGQAEQGKAQRKETQGAA